jgi:multiple sugar transport system substrate-binding protein
MRKYPQSLIWMMILLMGAIFLPSIKAAEKTTVTVWVGDWWKDNVPKIVQEYEKSHPNFNLKIELVPNVAYLEKATIAILGGSPPDVIDLGSYMVTSLTGKGLLQPWDKGSLKQLGDLKDFAQGIWSAGVYKGKVYAIPSRASSGVYLYNKTMFDAAGVPYPNENWTYKDLLEAAKKLTIPGKQYGFGVSASPTNKGDFELSICPMVWAFGGDFFNKDYTACTLNQPKAVEALTFWTELYTKHKVVPDGIANYTLSKDILQMFVNDKVAIMPGGDFTFKKIEEEEAARSSFRWGQQLYPAKINVGGGWSFGIPVSAAHPKEGREFVIWMEKPENMGRFVVRQPSHLSAANVEPWNTEKYSMLIKATKTQKPIPATPVWADAENIMITQLQKVLENKQTPKQAADEITRQVNALLKQQK